MNLNLKLAALAAVATAAFIGGAIVAMGPAKAADFGRDGDNRYDYGTRGEYSTDRGAYDRDTDGESRDGDDPDSTRRGDGRRDHCARVAAEGSYGNDYLPQNVKEWRAQRTAIEAWKSKVDRQYGAEFAHWRSASEKQVDCSANRGDVTCSVSAMPARGFGGWGWNSHGGWGGGWGGAERNASRDTY